MIDGEAGIGEAIGNWRSGTPRERRDLESPERNAGEELPDRLEKN